MKKLMFALVAVVLAAGVQAATVNWNEVNEVYTPDYGLAGGATYLIQNSAHGQDAFITALAGAGSVSAFASMLEGWAVDQTTTANGLFLVSGTATSDLTAKGSEQAYFAIIDAEGDRVFMSSIMNASYNEMGGADDYTFDGVMEMTSFSPAMKAKDGNMGAGWYTTESVPEPTSGLLLLLGVAGLALRRRRA